MAKSKKKQIDDEEKLQVKDDDADVEEADTEVDVEDADAEGAEDEPAEAKADDDGPGDDDSERSEDDTPPPPRAKLTKTAIAFLILNWIAVPAFIYCAIVDHTTRVQYEHRTLLNYIQVWGLPLKDEDKHSFSNETRPRIVLTSKQLDDVTKERTRKSYKDFQPVDEPVPLRIRESDMTTEMLDDVFRYQGLSDLVRTLDDEIARLRQAVPAAIESAAKEVLDKQKDDAEKRAVVQKALFAIAWDVWQVKNLEDMLAKAKGEDLDKLVLESVQRRMYYDILAPLNVYRPGEFVDAKLYSIEKLSDTKAYTLDDIKGFLDKRLKHAIDDRFDPEFHLGEFYSKEQASPQASMRGSDEKRNVIGFILFTLGQVTKHPLDEKLFAKGVERAQVVCGLYEFTNASIRYVETLRLLEDRLAQTIRRDRDGYVFELKAKAGEMANTSSFRDDVDAEIDRLIKIVEHIDLAQKRLNDLNSQRDGAKKTYAQRLQQQTDTVAKLLKARKLTKQSAEDLEQFQVQLHKALLELSDAGQRNLQLEAEIRAIELGLLKNAGQKGGKK